MPNLGGLDRPPKRFKHYTLRKNREIASFDLLTFLIQLFSTFAAIWASISDDFRIHSFFQHNFLELFLNVFYMELCQNCAPKGPLGSP